MVVGFITIVPPNVSAFESLREAKPVTYRCVLAWGSVRVRAGPPLFGFDRHRDTANRGTWGVCEVLSYVPVCPSFHKGLFNSMETGLKRPVPQKGEVEI